jgi:hypothetical protein
MKTTAYRFIITVLFVMVCTVQANATDCFSDCRKSCTTSVRYPCGIGRWCDREVLDPLCNGRCNTERTVACRTGINSCSFWKGNSYYVSIVEAIKIAHRNNKIKDVHHCHKIVSGAETASSAAGTASSIVTIASKGVESWWGALSFANIAYAEVVKHLARCACTSAF